MQGRSDLFNFRPSLDVGAMSLEERAGLFGQLSTSLLYAGAVILVIAVVCYLLKMRDMHKILTASSLTIFLCSITSFCVCMFIKYAFCV